MRILINSSFEKIIQRNKCLSFVLLPIVWMLAFASLILCFSKVAAETATQPSPKTRPQPSPEISPKTRNISSFYDKKAEGWHWYEDMKNQKAADEIKSEKPLTPTEEVEALKAELNHLLNKAILYPTSENVLTYKRRQEAFMEKSHEFARVWQRVTFENPDLDYSLKFPTQHTGRLIYKEEEGKRKDKVLRDLAKEYGLFYIFKSDCRYCTAFAPIVKGFSKKYGWDVLAISQDGARDEIINEEFPKAVVNNGMIENLQIDTFPALLAVHPETGRVIPLAYGLTSLSDIETRAYSLWQSLGERESASQRSHSLSPSNVIANDTANGIQTDEEESRKDIAYHYTAHQAIGESE
jgi:conjugal transfer pilus assembly protein TraF